MPYASIRSRLIPPRSSAIGFCSACPRMSHKRGIDAADSVHHNSPTSDVIGRLIHELPKFLGLRGITAEQ
jgi:hypothetical protein